MCRTGWCSVVVLLILAAACSDPAEGVGTFAIHGATGVGGSVWDHVVFIKQDGLFWRQTLRPGLFNSGLEMGCRLPRKPTSGEEVELLCTGAAKEMLLRGTWQYDRSQDSWEFASIGNLHTQSYRFGRVPETLSSSASSPPRELSDGGSGEQGQRTSPDRPSDLSWVVGPRVNNQPIDLREYPIAVDDPRFEPNRHDRPSWTEPVGDFEKFTENRDSADAAVRRIRATRAINLSVRCEPSPGEGAAEVKVCKKDGRMRLTAMRLMGTDETGEQELEVHYDENQELILAYHWTHDASTGEMLTPLTFFFVRGRLIRVVYGANDVSQQFRTEIASVMGTLNDCCILPVFRRELSRSESSSVNRSVGTAPSITMVLPSEPQGVVSQKRLEDRPVSVVSCSVDYPAELVGSGRYGTVLAEFIVEEDGSVSALRIARSDVSELADAVQNAIYKCRFRPAITNGRAERQSVQMPFVFVERKP